MKPTGNDVWEAILTDPQFVEESPKGSPQRKAIQPFIEGSVKALEDYFDDVVTLQTLFNAKLLFIRYCMKNNIGEVLGEATGMPGHMIDFTFEMLIEMLESALEDINIFLKENGVTEDLLMSSPHVGLNAVNLQKWRGGTLTIGELLLTQPGVIVRNSR